MGRLYAQRYFPASAKARAERMVAGLKRAFERRIDALSWMAPSTKAEAKAKLMTLRVSVGYPDKWPTYGALRVVAGDAYGNADRFDYPKTVLIDYSGNKNATITSLAKIFHVDPENIRRTPNVKSDVDIRIILGADWTPPPEKTQP